MKFKVGDKVAVCDPHCDILGCLGTVTGTHLSDLDAMPLYAVEGIPPDGMEMPEYPRGEVQPLGEFYAEQLELVQL